MHFLERGNALFGDKVYAKASKLDKLTKIHKLQGTISLIFTNCFLGTGISRIWNDIGCGYDMNIMTSTSTAFMKNFLLSSEETWIG